MRFPVENSTITLLITEVAAGQWLESTAVRKVLFDSYMDVTNIIDVAGDGDIPGAVSPYRRKIADASLSVDTEGPGFAGLKWSELKVTLWGLKEYMVVQGHLCPLTFWITRSGEPTWLGRGCVLYTM